MSPSGARGWQGRGLRLQVGGESCRTIRVRVKASLKECARLSWLLGDSQAFFLTRDMSPASQQMWPMNKHPCRAGGVERIINMKKVVPCPSITPSPAPRVADTLGPQGWTQTWTVLTHRSQPRASRTLIPWIWPSCDIANQFEGGDGRNASPFTPQKDFRPLRAQ